MPVNIVGVNYSPERSACLWFWIAQKFPAMAGESEERTIHLPCIPYRAIHIQSRPTELLQPFGRACGLGEAIGYGWVWGFRPG